MVSDDGDDVVGQGGGQGGGRPRLPDWGLSRGSVLLAALTLLVGLGAGYAAGMRHQSHGAARAGAAARAGTTATLPLAVVSPALTQLTTGCSAQIGKTLQLGVPVTNQSSAAVTLGEVKAVTPLGGLRAISQHWGPGGALPAGQASPSGALAPGDSTWFTVTFTVLVKCPRPLPVQFTIDYDVGSQHAVATLPGFPDLSQVPYQGCPAQS